MEGLEFYKSGGKIRVMDKSLKSQIAYSFFYLGVFIEVMLVLIDKSAYTNPILGQIFRLTFLLFLLKACLTKYSFKEYLLAAFFLLVGAASYFITGRNEIVRIVVFLMACKDADMIKCLKFVFWMTLTGCLVIMALAVLGIFGTLSMTMDYGRGSIETRYVLGIGHPNALQCMVCVLTMLGLYLYHDKCKWYSYLIVLGINVVFFLLTDSKTGLLVAVCSVFLNALIPKIRNSKLVSFFLAGNIGIYAGSIFISIMAAKDAMCLWRHFTQGEYSSRIKFYVFLDKLLTGRIHALIETKNHEGVMETWSLFSSPDKNYYFDMGWVRLFYWYGIIPATLAVVALTVFVIYFTKKKKLVELAFISMFALYTVVEAHFISVYIARNYLLFIIGMYWWQMEAIYERQSRNRDF